MFSNLEQTFRWYGPSDPVTLKAITQAGATGIVTALHHIPSGEVWSTEEIEKRKNVVQSAGLRWSVVESVNIHESIKTASPDREKYAENYIATLKNLSKAGINIVCYNFMPVLDWTRTDIDFRLPNGASALRFHAPALAAFDLYILEREGAYREFDRQQQANAKEYLDSLGAEQKQRLVNNIMAGLPGTKDVLTIDQFKGHLGKYKGIDADQLKQNLAWFLEAIIPEAEKLGVKMCIHPDDPPFPIMGLPRVVSKEEDLLDVINACPSPSNGLTFCTGSLGARGDNELPGMIDRLGEHIHFLHLRNVKREPDGSFYEDNHLEGSSDMYAIMKSVLKEQKRREENGRTDIAIPMRPDHGHKLLDDFSYDTFPGYSAIGRLKGLAELRGLEMGIKNTLYQ
ncbi:mannonate dehydratase [Mucilaginibacter ginsenosidivorans]|uniref:Mannonate dehydratase n=1 Tax=Mucilaginibacter ginsenosidivorans TaxID=398053 RepID=A0A5B8US72_9SPHI|nr:mannonate dehydratase [Mucilaginibacter ginsenosidivorans]QEC61874.1 mannonate dehydratase [Mucilaginibacter ginsenosidivorans]